MSCCGQKREQLRGHQSTRASSDDSQAGEPIAREPKAVMFEYIGGSKLTVRGAVTGTKYRFTFPGDRVEVAYADSFGMMAERDLRPTFRQSVAADATAAHTKST